MAYIYPLPHATANLRRDNCANPGLIFERFVGYTDNWSLKATDQENPRQDLLNEVITANNRLAGPDWQALRETILARWQQMVMAAGSNPQDQSMFKASPVWRFITGIGRNHPLEVGFTFDRVYGLPMIPGSSLKGLTRAYILQIWADEWGVPPLRAKEIAARKEGGLKTTPLQYMVAALSSEGDDRHKNLASLQSDPVVSSDAPIRSLSDDEFADRSEQFRTVFGATDNRGKTIFSDAIPEKAYLEIDIMTPHYPDYYEPSKNKWPSDWQDPNPVSFLTIGKESVFYFAVAGAHQAEVAKWLRAALDFPGVGAKTAAGYGAWQPSFFAVPAEWRQAVIRKVNPSRGWGTLADVETGREFRFRLRNVEAKGVTPGRKWTCEYCVETEGERETVRVRNPRRG